jgi:ADP-ribosylation factor 2-binding protein
MESKFEETSFGEDDFELRGEETYLESSGTAEEIKFDETVGALEDILIGDEEFSSVQNAFFDEHCGKFTDDEENRVEYTAIFEDYTTVMESTLERLLAAKVAGFNMHDFEKQLIYRKEDIAGDIFDLLLSFSDFTEFKAQILAHKRMREGGDGDFGDLLVVSNLGGGGGGGGGGLSIEGGLSLSISGGGARGTR